MASFSGIRFGGRHSVKAKAGICAVQKKRTGEQESVCMNAANEEALNNQFTMLDCEMIGSLFVIELFALIAGFAGLIDTELFEDAFIDL